MTSILAKICEAIEATRNAPNLIIDESTQNNNTRKLFISGVMDSTALYKWSEVYTAECDWLKFEFIDDFQDKICPSEATGGSKNHITIIFKNDALAPCIFTPEGWRQFLLNDAQVCKANAVKLAFIDTEFKTLRFSVSKWHAPSVENSLISEEKVSKTSPRKIVKYFSPDFLPSESISPWILDSLVPENNPAFDIWRDISCREILKCLTNELFVTEQKMVALSGNPPKKIEFGDNLICEQSFTGIQSAAKWIYCEGEEVELKHTFLTSELAREWPQGVSFCDGIVHRLPTAMDSARLLYKAHIRSSSKETLKALNDLRKNLADDMQKVVQQSKELTSSLWKDVALVIGTMVIKYTLDASKNPNASKIYSIVFFSIAIYIVVSHFMSVAINANFIKIVEENRISWRHKLYGYLDDEDYDALATRPISKAYHSYYCIKNISSVLTILLALFLVYLGASELFNIKHILGQLIDSAIYRFDYTLRIMGELSHPLFIIYR